MSDIFNQESAKSSFLGLIRRQGIVTDSTNILEYFVGQIEEVPRIYGDLKMGGLAKYCIEHNIPIQKPRGIPEDVIIVAKDVFGAKGVSRLGINPDTEMRMPLGKRVVIPFYNPNHSVTDPLYSCISAYSYHLAMLLATTPEKLQDTDWIVLGQEIVDTLNTVRFCTGTLDGQMNRLAQGTAIKEGLNGKHKNKSFRELGLTVQLVSEMLAETLPLNQDVMGFTLTHKLIGYMYTPEEAEMLGVDTDIPSVRAARSAGLPFGSKKKGDVSLEALALADSFLVLVSDTIGGDSVELKPRSAVGKAYKDPVKAAEEFTKLIMENLSGDYWYMAASMLFPKAERYVYADIKTKTRNISAASFITHLLGNQITFGPAENALNALNCSRPTPSLAKFSATQGGMDQFVNILLEADVTSSWVYADNIYMYYPRSDTWYSLDLEKGEANATREMAMAVAVYFLREGWSDESHNPLFNQTWAYIAMYVIPLCVVDGISLIGNLQLSNPGQSSGNPWTFLINHVCSTILLHFWTQAGKPEPSNAAAMEELKQKSGIDFKIELATKDVVKRLRDLPDKSIPIKDNRRGRTFVELDLLGWDVTHTDFGYTPVLARDRLVKSFACPQPPRGAFRYRFMEIIHKYVQAFGLLSCGAWAYPVMSRVVTEYMENYWLKIKVAKPLDENDEMAAELMEIMDEAIDNSAYKDELELLKGLKPLHLTDWADTLYGRKEKQIRDPKSTESRVFAGITRQDGESDFAFHKRLSSEISALRRSGNLVEDPAYASLEKLVHGIAPGDYKREIDMALATVGTKAYRTLVESSKEVADKVTYKLGPSAVEVWSQVVTGELQPGAAVLLTGLSVDLVNRVKFLPPPVGSIFAQDPMVYLSVTGRMRNLKGGELTKGEANEYVSALKTLATERLTSLAEYETTQVVASMYLVHSEVLLSQLASVRAVNPEIKLVGGVEEARNPTGVYKLTGRPLKSDLLAAHKGLPTSKAMARRDKRKKADELKKIRANMALREPAKQGRASVFYDDEEDDLPPPPEYEIEEEDYYSEYDPHEQFGDDEDDFFDYERDFLNNDY
jgi:hypothetical protein